MLALLPALAGIASAVVPSILGLLKTSPTEISHDTRIMPYRGGNSSSNDMVALKSAPPLFNQIAKSVHIGREVSPLVNGAALLSSSVLRGLISKVRGGKASSIAPRQTNPVQYQPAARRLVGIHPHPGPKGKGKKKSKAKPRRTQSHSMVVRSGNQSMTRYAAPVSEGIIGRKFIQMLSTGMPDSVKIVGHMFMGDVFSSSGGVLSFLNTIRGPLNGANSISLHPTWIAAPITTLATTTFLRYRFLRVTLHYIPACSTQTTGQVNIGFSPDGNTGVVSTFSRALVNSIADSTQGPMWAPIDIPLNLGDDGGCITYYCDTAATGSATANSAANRACLQGTIVLCSDALGPLAGSTQGSIWSTFELVMFGMGITSSLLAPPPPPPVLYDQEVDFEMVAVNSGTPVLRPIHRSSGAVLAGSRI